MSGFDGDKLQQLEAIFLVSRNVQDLEPLYVALISAGKTLYKAYSRGIGLRLSAVRTEEIIHDAVTRLIEMYLKHPDQQSMPLPIRLHLELKYQLHNPKQIKVDQVVPVTTMMSADTEVPEAPQPDRYIDTLQDAPDLDGKRIVVDLYRFRYYKRAILAIEKYTDRSLIYKYAKEIDKVWCVLHNKRRKA